jgi:hypothetical protein
MKLSKIDDGQQNNQLSPKSTCPHINAQHNFRSLLSDPHKHKHLQHGGQILYFVSVVYQSQKGKQHKVVHCIFVFVSYETGLFYFCKSTLSIY